MAITVAITNTSAEWRDQDTVTARLTATATDGVTQLGFRDFSQIVDARDMSTAALLRVVEAFEGEIIEWRNCLVRRQAVTDAKLAQLKTALEERLNG